LAVTNTLAYYGEELFEAVKCFMVQAQGPEHCSDSSDELSVYPWQAFPA